MQERRAYYRLQYPLQARPEITIGQRRYQVVDISEKSARVVFNEGLPDRPGTEISGCIRFEDGEEIEVTGATLRKIEGGLVIILSKGISFRRMIVEQVRLREKFPRFFSRAEAVKETSLTSDPTDSKEA